jgi:hypothetical protein
VGSAVGEGWGVSEGGIGTLAGMICAPHGGTVWVGKTTLLSTPPGRGVPFSAPKDEDELDELGVKAAAAAPAKVKANPRQAHITTTMVSPRPPLQRARNCGLVSQLCWKFCTILSRPLIRLIPLFPLSLCRADRRRAIVGAWSQIRRSSLSLVVPLARLRAPDVRA